MRTASKLSAYKTVDDEGSVEDANPQRLILLLMDGALESMSRATGHLQRNEIPAKAKALSRAVSLIDGLRAFLDHENGGDVAGSLESLYDYATRRLTEANVGNDGAMIAEVIELLRGIREAWAQVPKRLAEQQEIASA